MPHSNRLLARLSSDILEKISPHLSIVELERGQILAETHQPVRLVYFPHQGVISCVVQLVGGDAVETGMIGNDGQFGASQAIEDSVSLNQVVIQIGGPASVISVLQLSLLAREFVPFRALLLRFDQFLMAQIQQTAACNAIHPVEQRFCRWLLRMHELAGTELPITQEFLAEMMGVRRTSVSEVAGRLQAAGLISYARGLIKIIDKEGLAAFACDCHLEVQSHFERLFPQGDKTASGHSIGCETIPTVPGMKTRMPMRHGKRAVQAPGPPRKPAAA
jgi:CRP-like cAMP-binding protein